MSTSTPWPVLKRYDQAHLARIALPLGGIGTGTVSLGGRGDLRDWEVVNRPAKGFRPVLGRGGAPFFALWTKPTGGAAATRALEGPLELEDYEGASGSPTPNHGLPRFRKCSFAAAYPFGQVFLSDPDVPVDVRIEAFNPLVPADAEASGIPAAVLRFVLTNRTTKTITAAVCGNLPNFIGADGSNPGVDGFPREKDHSRGPKANRNEFRRSGRLSGLFMHSDGVPSAAEQWGTLALVALSARTATYRTGWAQLSWGDSLLDYWDDFSEDGELHERESAGSDSPVGSLAAKVRIPARATRAVTFLLTWHFPHRMTWTPKPVESTGCDGGACADPNRIGNYYTTQYTDAWDVVEQVAPRLPKLEAATVEFVRAFCDSDLPPVVKEAALFNLANLRSQTCFRTEDGRFYGFEGCHNTAGCCPGSCTHVWNYEQAVAFLFGDLAKSMREVEFAYATADSGLMSFRVNLPLDRAQESAKAAADGQMGCLMKLHRDWQLSGDDALLRTLWPKARKALEFCWIEGGWDADRDGVMEGCQHNTMDVEYFGPNPQMGGWYLGALRAAEEMARYLGEGNFADECRRLFDCGSRWMDANLFNGEYYEHEIRPPAGAEAIAPGLLLGMGAGDLSAPDLQLGAGCLVDQLVGQFQAHVCGLGYLLDRTNVRKTLRAIMAHNFRQGFHDHFNHLRSYVLGDESALLMATYPRGRRPKRPFPYFNEVMTGFEYAAAVHMLYEGQTANGLRCLEAIRARYDGRKRSPFDEAECGHHYARAMASWAAVPALTGFRYSGVEQSMEFAAQEGTHFWSTGYAWGTCRQKRLKNGVKVELQVRHGTLKLQRLALTGVGEVSFEPAKALAAGHSAVAVVEGGS